MVTITLKNPIKFGNEMIEKINLQEIKAKHLRGLPMEPKMSDLLDLAIKIGDQPKSVIDELSMADTKVLMTAVGGFLEDGPETGQKS